MTTYIKAKTVDAVPRKKDGKKGYEVTENGNVTWQAKSAFEHDHVPLSKKGTVGD